MVAVKRLKFTNDRIFYKIFKNEVINLKSIQHKNSVKYIDSFEEYPYLYIITEYCDENLNIFREQKPNKILSINEIRNICIQLNNIFKLFNKMNLIHRDIKPENILIKYSDNSHNDYTVKIADYGLSKVYDNSIITITNVYSTWGYIAPEFFSDNHFDNRCDLFSLGIVLLYSSLKYNKMFNKIIFKLNK